jgi:hypothetical protein
MEALWRFDHEIHRTNGRGLARHERGTFGARSLDDGENIGDLDDELPNHLNVEQEAEYEKIMAKMFQEARTPLYEGCSTSCLTTSLLLLNLITTHGVNNTFANELFTLLRCDLFLKDNTLPKSMYQSKKVVWRLGLSYNSIHAYYNGCVMFRRELSNATACPNCKRSQFVERLARVLRKVHWHFPLIPHLKHISLEENWVL